MDATPLRQLTAERLRLTLPLMTRHAFDYSPQSYALWFTYVSGEHPRLTAALQPVVVAERRLTADETQEMIGMLSDVADLDALQRIRNALSEVIEQTADANAHARETTRNVRASMTETAAQLSSDPGAAVARLMVDTGMLDSSLQDLDQRLRHSEAEVAQLRARLDEVRQEARTDALTRLLNRRAFDEALGEQIRTSHPTARPLSLVMIDADHFKRINDELGHLFGDRVLGSIAEVLRKNVKGRDVLARFGGEEFVALLPDTAIEGAAQLAEQLRAAVQGIRIRRSDTQAVVGNITVSCGVAQLRAGETGAELIDRADAALYEAKRSGRNRVSVA